MIYTLAHGFARALRFNGSRLVAPPAGLGPAAWSRYCEIDAAFAAGIAPKSLDDLLCAEPPWLGCWRDRLALKAASVAARIVDRSEEENAIRDAVSLTSVSRRGGRSRPRRKAVFSHTIADAPI
ncbi:DUF1403 family protein [Agrobacterium sp. a22-2]|uniref:DUF1403 family protein n=1 Tax=Agrobacterium sp. a22-2 TaxID=2283840 RepID=UPI0034CF2BC7